MNVKMKLVGQSSGYSSIAGSNIQQTMDRHESELNQNRLQASTFKTGYNLDGRQVNNETTDAKIGASPLSSPWARSNLERVKSILVNSYSLLLTLVLLLATLDLRIAEAASTASIGPTSTTTTSDQRGAKAALEAELNSLLQQHDGPDANSKLLSEAIISRWMLGNLSDSMASANSNELLGASADLDGSPQLQSSVAEMFGLQPMAAATPVDGGQTSAELDQSSMSSGEESENHELELSGPEAMRLRKMLSYLHNYELAQAAGGLNNGQAFNQYPVLPASQAATIKRASIKMGNYLRQQQHGQARQMNGYGRNTFDFGLGKRPDSSAGSVLRFGDSAGVPVSGQFGKRPSAHRYDFGLGKRVASVSIIQ